MCLNTLADGQAPRMTVSAVDLFGPHCLNTLADGQAPRISLGKWTPTAGTECLNTLADGQAPRIFKETSEGGLEGEWSQYPR